VVRDWDIIAIEALNVNALAKSALAKPVRDASWGQFISMLRYKAARAGAQVVEVSSYDTSQICSGCGVRVPKELGVRGHQCDRCGLSIDRDVNAARNVLYRAGVGPGLPNVAG
jgi:putative transposase